jgi:hypothetical protein
LRFKARLCAQLGKPAVLNEQNQGEIMKRILAAVVGGLFLLTHFTLAQNPVARPGIFEPAGAGFNHQTSGWWDLAAINGTNGFDYGAAGDIPVVGEWDGQYYAGIGVFRPAGSPYNRTTSDQWLLRNLELPGNPDIVFYYGAAGDLPVVGHWAGPGQTTIGVYRPPGTAYNRTTSGEWLLRNSNTPGNPDIAFYYGAAGDLPVVGDWTGIGQTTIGIYRPPGTRYNRTNQGQWLLRNSNTPGKPNTVIYYGAAGDVPVVGDWTGIGQTTIGVYRPAGTLYNKTNHGQYLLRNSNTPGRPDIAFYDFSSDYASAPIVGNWSPLIK